jgi:peptidoglycan/xylan/chitin deacetylase (PgdA/CDA1 family)
MYPAGSGRPLILGYHAVSSTWPAQLAVPEAVLRVQLGRLAQRGYVGLTLAEAERRRSERTLPSRTVVVTFDDGYASTLRAVPILEELGFPATLFVVTRFIDTDEPLSWPGIEQWTTSDTRDELRPVCWRDLERLLEAGWEIGSHTVSHPLLTAVDDERLLDELVASRRAIEARLGSCASLSYPYGVADDRVAAASERAGYSVACALTFTHLVDEPFRRPRTGLSAADTGVRLWLKISGLGQRARRGAPARLARKLHRRRDWLPVVAR